MYNIKEYRNNSSSRSAKQKVQLETFSRLKSSPAWEIYAEAKEFINSPRSSKVKNPRCLVSIESHSKIRSKKEKEIIGSKSNNSRGSCSSCSFLNENLKEKEKKDSLYENESLFISKKENLKKERKQTFLSLEYLILAQQTYDFNNIKDKKKRIKESFPRYYQQEIDDNQEEERKQEVLLEKERKYTLDLKKENDLRYDRKDQLIHQEKEVYHNKNNEKEDELSLYEFPLWKDTKKSHQLDGNAVIFNVKELTKKYNKEHYEQEQQEQQEYDKNEQEKVKYKQEQEHKNLCVVFDNRCKLQLTTSPKHFNNKKEKNINEKEIGISSTCELSFSQSSFLFYEKQKERELTNNLPQSSPCSCYFSCSFSCFSRMNKKESLIPITEKRTASIQWKKGEQIGEGTFGKVFMGLNEITGELFAVKEIKIPNDIAKKNSRITKLEEEISLMRDLNHKHIVRYLGTDYKDSNLHIFMEYIPGGSIASMLAQFGVFNEDLIKRYIRQILKGVEYLHSKGIIHRDIKGPNVLVNEQGIAKLADFGCSKQLQDVRSTTLEESLHAIRGSVPWMAPEVIKQTGHGRKADIWSIGATMIEMASASNPWPNYTSDVAVMYNIATSDSSPPIPEHLSIAAKLFLKRCFVINPEERANASDLLKDPFLEERNI